MNKIQILRYYTYEPSNNMIKVTKPPAEPSKAAASVQQKVNQIGLLRKYIVGDF
jgi:hypothetical protein